jgi:hypothetical protein
MGKRLARPLFLTAASGLMLCVSLSASGASTPCSDEQIAAAQDVMREMASLGTASHRDGYLEYHFSSDFDAMTPVQRKLVIEGYANADACIHGVVQEMRFYRNGKLVGKTDRDSTIEIHF